MASGDAANFSGAGGSVAQASVDLDSLAAELVSPDAVVSLPAGQSGADPLAVASEAIQAVSTEAAVSAAAPDLAVFTAVGVPTAADIGNPTEIYN